MFCRWLVIRAMYHRAHADFRGAERLLERALTLAERSKEPGVRLVPILNSMAVLYKDLGRYDAAWELYQRALAILEGELEAAPADVATLYHNLGGIDHARGQFDSAECWARKGLALRIEHEGASVGGERARILARRK